MNNKNKSIVIFQILMLNLQNTIITLLLKFTILMIALKAMKIMKEL